MCAGWTTLSTGDFAGRISDFIFFYLNETKINKHCLNLNFNVPRRQPQQRREEEEDDDIISGGRTND